MSTERATLDFVVEMMTDIWLYYIPVLICLGSVGNCLSVYIPLRTAMRRSSASLYIVALAVSDEGFLIFLAIDRLAVDFQGFSYVKERFATFFIWLPTLCNFLSAWFVVAFTVERFVAVRYPLYRQSICTVARAKMILTGITCAGLMASTPVFWLIDRDPKGLDIRGYLRSLFIFRLVTTIITVVVPFTLIAVFNVLIVKSLRCHAEVRIRLSSTTSGGDEASIGPSHQRSSRVPVSQAKTTKMLLIVSSVFLCLNLPFNVMTLYSLRQPLPGIWSGGKLALIVIKTICNMLLATSFGINFFLYCASGHEFRKAVLSMIACRPRSWSPKKLLSCLHRMQVDTSCTWQKITFPSFRRNLQLTKSDYIEIVHYATSVQNEPACRTPYFFVSYA